jgi:glycosyltransferase involved in cell wall biosynthesis
VSVTTVSWSEAVMKTTPTLPADDPTAAQPEAQPRQVIGRFVPSANGSPPYGTAEADRNGVPEEAATRPRSPVAVFCHEPPDSYIGGHVARIVPALAKRGTPVHLFCRHPFVFADATVRVHVVGAPEEGELIDQVQEFNRRASNTFMQQFPPGSEVGVALGYEWTAAPVLELLQGLRNIPTVLSIHTLERQRSDVTGATAQRIEAIELGGLRQARRLLIHDGATAEVARFWVPECAGRTVLTHSLFPMDRFEAAIDPGAIKARYQVGPIDPVILYVGDLDERYGPDLLVKAMPAILRHHPQARLVIVGDGHLFWPLKVYTRYLLLEHAIRLVGHVAEKPLDELIQAADIVAVPSRESTPWWPIQAAWAARRPLVATHQSAPGLIEHEIDGVLVYPSENSLVWGIERVLYDEALRRSLGQAGRAKLEERFGWNGLAEQVEEVLGSLAAV